MLLLPQFAEVNNDLCTSFEKIQLQFSQIPLSKCLSLKQGLIEISAVQYSLIFIHLFSGQSASWVEAADSGADSDSRNEGSELTLTDTDTE